MAILRMKYREDYWFVGGLLLVLVFGIIAGTTLALPFLAACTIVLGFVWLVTIGYAAAGRPGPGLVWFCLATPILIITTWVAVVVSVWGFTR